MSTTLAAPSPKKGDPDYQKWYHRELKRKKSTVKRHPNIMPDGSKWSDHHPYGRFSSEEEYKAHKKTYYTASPKETCSCCGVEYYLSRKDMHMNSKRHAIAVEVLKLHNPPFVDVNGSTKEDKS